MRFRLVVSQKIALPKECSGWAGFALAASSLGSAPCDPAESSASAGYSGLVPTSLASYLRSVLGFDL